MFKALQPLLTERSIHILLSPAKDGKVGVYVEPVKLDDKEDNAFITPFRCEGTPEELDAELPGVLAQWLTSRAAVTTSLRDALAAYEAGEPMTQLHLLPWSACQAQAMPLRHAVFAQEKGIPPELMGDEADATAVHVLVTNHLGLALATGRMVLPASLSAPSGSAAPTPGQQAGQGRRTGQVGRMAVLHAQRSQGLGARMLHALLQQARELGLDDVVLHAQLGAVDFYARHGFERQQNYVAEVLTEEWRLAPGALEVAWFAEETAAVERAVDAFSKRLDKLEGK